MRRLKIISVILLTCLFLGLAGPGSALASEIIHVVQPGENLFRISLRYGTTVQAIAAANGIVNPSRIYVGQRLVIPGAAAAPSSTATVTGYNVYVVQRGDTLSRIARRFGTTVQDLVAINGIANPNLVHVGQQLSIGVFTSSAATSGPSVAPPPATQAVVLVMDQISYQHESRWVDLLVRVYNNGIYPAIASGRYFAGRNPDGTLRPVSWFPTSLTHIPYPLRGGGALMWEFHVTTNDGLIFPAFANCVFVDDSAGDGSNREAFNCSGHPYGQAPGSDIRPGTSGAAWLRVYLEDPHSQVVHNPSRRVARLDFYPYLPDGTPLGLQDSVYLN
jgi:LysM repeat protein